MVLSLVYNFSLAEGFFFRGAVIIGHVLWFLCFWEVTMRNLVFLFVRRIICSKFSSVFLLSCRTLFVVFLLV